MEMVKQTALIVDDALANIEMLSIELDTEYEVLFATGGQEALDGYLDKGEKNLVFLY